MCIVRGAVVSVEDFFLGETMLCVVRMLSREWSFASHRWRVASSCYSGALAQRERFTSAFRFSFFSSETSSELSRIFDDNKRDPELVNHNLYKLFLAEDTIRLAHRIVVGNAKDFYERRKLVRGIVSDLADEKFQFEALSKPSDDASHVYEPPPFRDKVLLEAMRLVLHSVYEPVFLDSSHGSRPARSRHTALKSVRRELSHHTHALVAHLSHGLDHHVLTNLLSLKIGDKRFIRLVWKALNAGHGSSRKRHLWTVKNTWDGKHHDSPTLSTLLSNIYLHSLDTWIRNKKQRFDSNPPTDPGVLNLAHRIARLEREGKQARAHILRARMAHLARRTPKPRTIFYVRHGDELMLSFRARKDEVLAVKQDLEAFLTEMKLAADFSVVRFATSHAFFLGTKITVASQVRLEAPMDRIVMELAKLGMVSVGGTRPHPVTYLARCSHNEIIRYYNWVMRGCCGYYSFVDNFYELTSYMRLALRSSCVRTLTMKLKRFRSARTYKEFGAELAARYRVPIKAKSSEEVEAIFQERMRAAKRARLEEMGEIERGLLQRFVIPRRREEANGDVYLEFRGDCLLYCSKSTEHEETRRVLRKMELLPPPQNVWDFKEVLVPPPRPRLSVDYESLYPR